jgi:imidazolonepropionase
VRTLVAGIRRLVSPLGGPTGAAGAPAGASVTVVERAAVVVEAGRVSWSGPERDLPADLRSGCDERIDLGGALVTPGLVDAHTHPLYTRPRLEEVARRTETAADAGLAAGGGIAATVAMTRATPLEVLAATLATRLSTWLEGGATTVEAKTGYHLHREGELAAVRLLAAADGRPGLPRVEPTLLAAHVPPPEWADDPSGYAALAADWAAAAAASGARHADVFCDVGAFSVSDAERVLLAARRAGLRLHLHADELARTGGAALAARLRVASASHLLCADRDDAAALARAGVVAVLCPPTALALGRRPPLDALRETGVTVALGSDHNPGTSGTTSMSLVVGLAVLEWGLPLGSALAAATLGSARALGLVDRGTVAPGARADLVAWDADHEGAFAWELGLRARTVLLDGVSAARTPSSPSPASAPSAGPTRRGADRSSGHSRSRRSPPR